MFFILVGCVVCVCDFGRRAREGKCWCVVRPAGPGVACFFVGGYKSSGDEEIADEYTRDGFGFISGDGFFPFAGELGRGFGVVKLVQWCFGGVIGAAAWR